MNAEYFPATGSIDPKRRLPASVFAGTGTPSATISATVVTVPRFGRRAAIVIACPVGSLGAMLDAAELATLRDEIDRVEAELLGTAEVRS